LTGSRSGSRSRSSRNTATAPRPKKRLGQHFLSDLNILNRIVDAADLGGESTVLEIGPGRGTLTAVLAERAQQVVAVEVDRDLTELLHERFAASDTVRIIEADALDRTPEELLAQGGAAPPYVVVANLPYNIAAPVLRHLLEAETPPQRLVVMVQLEVGEAICAKPGSMSLLSVATQVYADPHMVMKLPPGAFAPPPKVQSAVVRLDVLPRPRVDVPIDAFFRIVRGGFGNPRKQLRNSLSFGLHVKQEVVDELMERAGIDATLRPQMLSIGEWGSITRAWLPRSAL
jgi:16S rRNA (adenine1518-N6/adenine1519-N6)-dimethyltransferase